MKKKTKKRSSRNGKKALINKIRRGGKSIKRIWKIEKNWRWQTSIGRSGDKRVRRKKKIEKNIKRTRKININW